MNEITRLIEQYERILSGAKISLEENDCDFTRERICEYEIIVDALRLAQLGNAPLTLDELRQMGGEPVWFVEHERNWDISEWVLCIKQEGNWTRFMRSDGNAIYRDSSRYGKTWRAYRRKPKEAT